MNYIETPFPPDYIRSIKNPHFYEHSSENKNECTTLLAILLLITALAIFSHHLNQQITPQKNNTNQYE